MMFLPRFPEVELPRLAEIAWPLARITLVATSEAERPGQEHKAILDRDRVAVDAQPATGHSKQGSQGRT